MLATWLSPSSSFRLAKKSSNSEVQSTLLTEREREGERERERESVKEDKLDSFLPRRNVLQRRYWEHRGWKCDEDRHPKTLPPRVEGNTSKLRGLLVTPRRLKIRMVT